MEYSRTVNLFRWVGEWGGRGGGGRNNQSTTVVIPRNQNEPIKTKHSVIVLILRGLFIDRYRNDLARAQFISIFIFIFLFQRTLCAFDVGERHFNLVAGVGVTASVSYKPAKSEICRSWPAKCIPHRPPLFSLFFRS